MPLKFTLSLDFVAYKAEPDSPLTAETARLHHKVAEGGWRLASVDAPVENADDLCPVFIRSHGELSPGTGCLTVKAIPGEDAGAIIAGHGFAVSKRLAFMAPVAVLTERIPLSEIGTAIAVLSADPRVAVVEPEIIEYFDHR